MQNKLQELTDRLYNEGLSKGKKEAEELVKKAEKQAADIISEARKKAEDIMKEAEDKAAELENKTARDLKMAGSQTVASIKQKVETAIVSGMISKDIASAMEDGEFIRSVIRTIAEAFNPDSAKAVPLELILPENMKQDMDRFLQESLGKTLNAGIEVRYEKMKSGGFRIGPKDGSYRISFTADDFENLIAEYLRPKTREILFG